MKDVQLLHDLLARDDVRDEFGDRIRAAIAEDKAIGKMTDKAKIREALERIDFHCQPGDDAGNVEWWVTVNGKCKGGTKIGHGSIIMRAFTDWKRARDEALAREVPKDQA